MAQEENTTSRSRTSRATDGLRFQVANAEQLPFGDAEFDLIQSKDSLHHMDDPAQALTEDRRVLKPGGTALTVEGNRYNPIFFCT